MLKVFLVLIGLLYPLLSHASIFLEDKKHGERVFMHSSQLFLFKIFDKPKRLSATLDTKSHAIIMLNEDDLLFNHNHKLISRVFNRPLDLCLSYIIPTQREGLFSRLDKHCFIGDEEKKHQSRQQRQFYGNGIKEIKLDQYGNLHLMQSYVNDVNSSAVDGIERLLRAPRNPIDDMLWKRCNEEKVHQTLISPEGKLPKKLILGQFIDSSSSEMISYLTVHDESVTIPLKLSNINEIIRPDDEEDDACNDMHGCICTTYIANLLVKIKFSETGIAEKSLVPILLRLFPASSSVLCKLKTRFKMSSAHDAQRYLPITYLYTKEPIDGYLIELVEAPSHSSCTLEDLLKYHEKGEGPVLRKTDRAFIIYKLINLVFFLHSQHCAHQNLKPSEILIDATTENLKLVHLNIVPQNYQDPRHRTWQYMAPEHGSQLTDDDEKNTLKGTSKTTDMWAVGCIAFRVLKGQVHPLLPKYQVMEDLEEKKELSQALDEYSTGKKKIDYESTLFTTDVKNMLEELLSINDELRANVQMVMDMDWMKRMRQKEIDGQLKLSPETKRAISLLSPKITTDIDVKTNSKKKEKKRDEGGKGEDRDLWLVNTKFTNRLADSVYASLAKRLLPIAPYGSGFNEDFYADKNLKKHMAHAMLQQLDQLIDQLIHSPSSFKRKGKFDLSKTSLQFMYVDSLGRMHVKFKQITTSLISSSLMEQFKKMLAKLLSPSLLTCKHLHILPVNADTLSTLGILSKAANAQVLPLQSSDFVYLPKEEKFSSFQHTLPSLFPPLNDDKQMIIRGVPFPLTYLKIIFKGRAKSLYLVNLNRDAEDSAHSSTHLVLKVYKVSKFRSSKGKSVSDFEKAVQNALYLTSFGSDYVVVTYGASASSPINFFSNENCRQSLESHFSVTPTTAIDHQFFRSKVERLWELMEPLGCSLQTLLEDKKAQDILLKNQEDRDTLAMHLLHLLRFLHFTAGVVHRDLKPANICFDLQTFKPKLIDFEHCLIVNKDKFGTFMPFEHYPQHASWAYAAPEDIAYEEYKVNTIPSPNLWEGDIWSMGFILYMIYTGLPHPLFSDTKNLTRDQLKKASIQLISNKSSLIKSPMLCKTEEPVMQVIKGMLKPFPSIRMTMKDIEQSMWWKQTNLIQSIDKRHLSEELTERIIQLTNEHLEQFSRKQVLLPDEREIGEIRNIC